MKPLGEGILLTEAFSHYSPAKTRHKAAFSNELLKHLPVTPSASLQHRKHAEKPFIPDPETDPFPVLHLHRGKSAYRASKYPQISLSPELDRKMKLIAGYQLLMDLEVAEDKGLTKPAMSPEAKRRAGNQDSREFLKLKRSLLAIKKCEVCHNMYCSCLKPVPDKPLTKLTKRFERLRRRAEISPSLELTKSVGAIKTHRKSSDCRSPVKTRPKDTESPAIGHSSQSEIVNVETKLRGREVELKACGYSLRSASASKPQRLFCMY